MRIVNINFGFRHPALIMGFIGCTFVLVGGEREETVGELWREATNGDSVVSVMELLRLDGWGGVVCR